MNTNVIAGLSATSASLKTQVEEGNELVAKLRAKFVASLDTASPEQATACVTAARDVKVSKADGETASGLGKRFRLTDEQADQVAAARAEHKVLINTKEVKAEASAMVLKCHLSTYKLRTRKDGRVALSISGLVKE